jgi:hypothetical protein
MTIVNGTEQPETVTNIVTPPATAQPAAQAPESNFWTAKKLQDLHLKLSTELKEEKQKIVSEIKNYADIVALDIHKLSVHFDELKNRMKEIKFKAMLARFFHVCYATIIIVLMFCNTVQHNKSMMMIADNEAHIQKIEAGLENPVSQD